MAGGPRVFVLIDLWSERLCPLICEAEEKGAFWPEVLQNESIWALGFLSIPTRSFFIM